MKDQVIGLIKCFLLVIAECLIIAVVTAILLRIDFWEEQQAYLYRLLFIALLCCVALFIIFFILSAKRKLVWGLSFTNTSMTVIIAGLFMALFFSLGPMVIERSYTVYSLAYLTDYDKLYTYEEIRDQFVVGYVDAGATKKRIDEQVSLGNLERVDNKYQITEKGKILVEIFRLVEKVFPVPDTSSIYPDKISE